jgi:hypothetical protein
VTAPDAPEPIGRTPRQVAGPEVEPEREDDAGDSPAVDLRERPGSDPDPEVEPEPTGDADREVEPEPTGDADREVEPEPTGDADREVEPEPAAEPEPVGFELASAMDPDPEIGPDDGFDDGFMGETDELRRRWEAVQAGFVDDPRRTVEQADEMVSAAVAALQAHIEQRREDLAETWRDGAQASTDALLAAFQRYRELFEGVLST